MDRGRLEKIIPVLAQKHNFRLEIVEKDYKIPGKKTPEFIRGDELP